MATTAATPFLVPKKSQEGLVQYQRQCYQMLNQQWNIREQMRLIDLKYIREIDYTTQNVRAKIANNYGDSTKFQNITVPVVMPQVENAVTYQTSVFLTGNPLFTVVSDPKDIDAALQMTALIEDQQTKGKWTQQFILALRDAFKYNLACVECDWSRCVTAALDSTSPLTQSANSNAAQKQVLWEGNKIKRMDMYNTFFDSRVAPSEMHEKGEFSGYTELMSRVRLKTFINELPAKMIENIIPAFESGFGGGTGGGFGAGGIESYYVPEINPTALFNKDPRATTNWLAWAGLSPTDGITGKQIEYKNLYEVTTLYGRIIPSDFGMNVPAKNTPQVWKLIYVNHQVLIYAERMTNAHGFIPMFFAQPLEDGLTYQTKSLAQNVEPIQDVSTALMNSVIASARRRIGDRVLYNPSLINKADINSDNPSAKIPVRPNAYGRSLAEAVYHFPYDSSVDQYAMQQVSQLGSLANQISGQNPARQGQFVKGNKTLAEYSDVMAHSNGRDQLCSILLEAQWFTPIKEVIKANILQYQGGVSLYSPSQKQVVNVDPVALRKSMLSFKISDGLLPADKLMNSDQWTVAMQVIGSSPQIGAQYDIAGMFTYLMKQQQADISDFEKPQPQVQYEQAMQAWSQTTSQITVEFMNSVAQKGMSIDDQVTAITALQKAFPPQPNPTDYGYTPGAAPGAAVSTNQTPQSQSSNSALNSQLEGATS